MYKDEKIKLLKLIIVMILKNCTQKTYVNMLFQNENVTKTKIRYYAYGGV